MQDCVLIIGGSAAGLRAALDLANSGFQVLVIEPQPFLLPHDQHDLIKTQFNQVAKHSNIKIMLNTQVSQIRQNGERISVDLSSKPRYVDINRCTACNECVTVCPVTVPGSDHRAIYLEGAPDCMSIEKTGRSPCASACPSGVDVQGYIALLAHERYQEAIGLIRKVLPFPSVCGRVCNHQCETACSRGAIDDPVNIMALKRYVADWAYENDYGLNPVVGENISGSHYKNIGKRIAVIGSGPAGLTAARGLNRIGYGVTVFDALPVAGGMMRVGIPSHRLPSHLLDWEIQQILDEGVELKLNTKIEDVPALLEDGFSAVLIATGAHMAKKLRIPNADHPDNWLSLDFLCHVRLVEERVKQEQIDLNGKCVVVLGGGNVALDCARTAVRLGAKEVRVSCLEPRGEMPGFEWEIQVAEEEGIQFFPGRTFKEVIVEGDKVVGLGCTQVDFFGFEKGLPKFNEIPGTEQVLPADVIIWAIGQVPDLTLLSECWGVELSDSVRVETDEEMMTTLPGIFVAGDVRRGQTFFVVDAIGEGNRAARSIDRYLRGAIGMQEPIRKPRVNLEIEDIKKRMSSTAVSPEPRTHSVRVPLKDQTIIFNEENLTFTKEQASQEAHRCLSCGPCSECLACVQVCSANAIIHDQQEITVTEDFRAVIYAQSTDNFKSLAVQDASSIYFASPDYPLEGSRAAAMAMTELGRSNGSYYQLESEHDQKEPERLGVLVCECGGEISNHVDVRALTEIAVSWPGVVHSQSLTHSCLPESSKEITEIIRTQKLDKVVLGACLCCTLDQVCNSCTFQRVRAKKNIGVFSPDRKMTENIFGSWNFEYVNIREQCAWVHSDNLKAATGKAIALVRAAAARGRVHTTLTVKSNFVEGPAMVLGRGDSAAACSQVFEKLEMESYRFYAMPEEIQRSTGQYLVYIEGESYRTSSIVLAPASKPEENEVMASLRVHKPYVVGARHADGLYTLKPGILLCDPDVEPSLVGPAAAAQTLAWMGQLKSRGFTNTAFVDPVYCRSCGTCIEICEYGAPELHEDESQGNVWIDPALCQGCGTCITHCPSGAIRNQMSTDAQLAASLREINLDEKWLRGQKRIVVLTCNWNGYLNLEAAGKKRGEYSPAIFPLRVSCLGEITSGIILKAFQFGADGVLMLGCNEEECHYCFGSRLAEDVVVEARNLVRLLGLQEDRLKILRLSARDELSFEQIANTFIDTIRED